MNIIQKISEGLTRFINKYLMKTGDEYLELRYGVSVIVLNFFKISSVIVVAIALGIQKYVLIYFMAFVAIRIYGFGAHASKTIVCTILNFIVFIGGSYLCLFIYFDKYDVIAMFSINIFILYKYAPAATKKRPIVSSKMITRCKISSVFIALILMVVSIVIGDNSYRSLLTMGAFTGCIFITPIACRLLGEGRL